MRDSSAAKHEHSQQLLQVAQFLTTFQDYFRGDDEPFGRNISMMDVQEAIDYQGLLEERVSLKCRVSNWNADDGVGTAEDKKEQLEDVKSQIADVEGGTKLIHRILKRFEVWMTKDLAQTMFMMPPNKHNPEGGSPLLNLPSSASFANELTVKKAVLFSRKRRWKTRLLPSKTLLLPPNRWTWQEYLRLGYMVSLLPTEKDRLKAQQSCVTATAGFLKGPTRSRKTGLKAGKDEKLSSEDLVALWIRAQRNTSAWRHYTQLFRIERVTKHDEAVRIAKASGSSGKTLVNEESGVIVEEYVAHYLGNHPKLTSMVRKDANHMDALVEWAVINQVLFTNEHMVEGITAGTIPTKTLEIPPAAFDLPQLDPLPAPQLAVTPGAQRPVAGYEAIEKKEVKKRLLEEDASSQVASKKQRAEAPTEEDVVRLRIAKQGFLLRWFARRNRKVTSILLHNNLYSDLPIHQTLFATMVEEDVPEKVKHIMQETYGTDRTFARIDRRMSKYLDGDSFQEAVQNVLKALKKSTELLSGETIDAAIADFGQLYDCFLGGVSTKGLIDESGNVEDVIEQLGAVRPPWVTNCGVCNKPYKDKTAPIVCSNCEKPMHTSCCGETRQATISLQKIAKTFAPLSSIFSIRIPLSRPAPDFRNLPDLVWTRLELTVDMSNGGGFRLAIHHTENCKEDLIKLLSERCDASQLSIPPFKGCQPMAVDQNGILVSDILSGSPAIQAGLQEGDIITHFKKDASCDAIALCEMDATERVMLLQETKGRPVLIIQRPSKPLLELSKEWLRDLKKANRSAKRVLESETIQTFCADCYISTPPTANRNAAEEAQRCLAVIRRLSMESYSIPFHQDGHCIGCESDNQYVSLRRLDQMMLSIIDSKALSGAGYAWPFRAPPQLNEDGNCTSATKGLLSWLSEPLMDSPYELLCRAMKILLTAPIALCKEGTKDPFLSERSALACHFLSLFSSWCLRFSFNIGCIPTSGPPPAYSRINGPWINQTCKLCMLPLLSCDESGDAYSCSRQACKANRTGKPGKASESKQTSQIHKDGETEASIEKSADAVPLSTELQSLRGTLRRYNNFASLVGSVLLVLPQDPILDIPAHFLQQPWIKEVTRPTPFIVASYLPSYFAKPRPGSCVQNNECQSDTIDGIFHLLPVIYNRQLDYLEKIADMRNPPGTSSVNITKGWVNLAILNLDGVVCLTPRQLLRKRAQTQSVLSAMSLAVTKQVLSLSIEESAPSHTSADSQIENHLPSDNINSSGEGAGSESFLLSTGTKLNSLSAIENFTATTSQPRQFCEDLVAKYSTLVDSTISCNSERTQEIIESLSTIQSIATSFDDQDTNEDGLESVAETGGKTHTQLLPNEGTTDMSTESRKERSETQDDIVLTRDLEAVQTELVSTDRMLAPSTRATGDDGHQGSREADETLLLVHGTDRAVLNEIQGHEYTGLDSDPSTRAQNDYHTFDLTGTDSSNSASVPTQRSRLITSYDLFQAGPIGTSLTRAEAAVVYATLQRGHLLLARRLLCPRYGWALADEQVRTIQLSNAALIQVIDAEFMDYIFRIDYFRSLRETGEVIAHEGGYSYKLPSEPLPIDILVGQWLRRREQQTSGSQPSDANHQPQHSLHHRSPQPNFQQAGMTNASVNLPHTQTNHHTGQALSTGQRSQFPSSQVPNHHRPVIRCTENQAQHYMDTSTASLSQLTAERADPSSRTDAVLHKARQSEERGTTFTGLQFKSMQLQNQHLPPISGTGKQVQRSSAASLSHSTDENANQFSKTDCSSRIVSLGGDSRSSRTDCHSLQTTAAHGISYGTSACADGSTYRTAVGLAKKYSSSLEKSQGTWCAPSTLSEVAPDCQRIRGGGPNENLSRRLEEMPDSDWGGQIVTATVETKKDGEIVHADIVGFIDEEKKDVDDDLEIDVDVIFLSNHGQFDTTWSRRVLLSSIAIVEEGSEYHRIAKEWLKDHPSESMLGAKTNSGTRTCDSGRNLASRFNRNVGLSSLGCLPDGRKVLWMSCEPTFVQLRCSIDTNKALGAAQASEASRVFDTDVGRKTEDNQNTLTTKYSANMSCFWGCRSVHGPFLSFDRKDQLVDHLTANHKYSSSKGNLLNVAAGNQIVSLASALVTSACARCPPLLELTAKITLESTSPSHQEPQFDLERILEATQSISGTSLTTLMRGYLGDKTALRKMVNLWSRLARLFDLERNGASRINHLDIQVSIPSKCYEVIEDNVDEESFNHCFDCTVTSEQFQFSQCQLCTSDSDACVKPSIGDNVGLGCSLIGSIGRRTRPTSVYQGISAAISMTKSLLVHTATNMPLELREKKSPNQTLWNDGSFQEWCKFVELGMSVRILAQAFVVLLSNLQKSKLPAWWKSPKAGWSKSFVVMSQPTSSGLLLQLYVLDAAIAGFVQQNKISRDEDPKRMDPVPKKLRVLETEARMKKIAEWANEIDVPETEDSQGMFSCVVCEDGGELLCCSYCATVQHRACCDPPIGEAAPVGKWACDSCIKDISELKKSRMTY